MGPKTPEELVQRLKLLAETASNKALTFERQAAEAWITRQAYLDAQDLATAVVEAMAARPVQGEE